MFPAVDAAWSRRRTLALSCFLHAILLAWLLFPATPTYIKPHLLMAGERGTSSTHVYWLAGAPLQDFPSRTQTARLRLQRPAQKSDRREKFPKVAQEDKTTFAAPDPAPLAGLPNGSVDYGSDEGFEVRPAIRVSGSEPAVAPGDLAGVPEGNIVVEVTIDERGNIVRKIVLQGLGPVIDDKVLAALQDWRFLPATRDGVAIPSRQDVHYHYPVRR